MLEKEFLEMLKSMEKEEHRIMCTKGIEYTQNDLKTDRLANFYRIAKELNIDPKIVLYVYMKKHWDSVLCYLKTNKEFSEEKIEGRIHDIRNYLVLLMGIIKEQKKENK